MIPPYLFYQIYPSSSGPDDCTPPKCGELSEYTDSAHTEVGDLSSRLLEGKGMFYLTTHSTHFIHGYMASDIW